MNRGFQCILVFHLFINICVVSLGIVNIILQQSLKFNINQYVKLVAIGWYLAGILIIVGALHGFYNRIETTVRIYFWYLFLTCVVYSGVLIVDFLIADTCVTLAHINPIYPENSGDAFKCGVTRVGGYSIAFVLILAQLHILWLVWSALQNLRRDAYTITEFSELLYGRDMLVKNYSLIHSETDFITHFQDTPFGKSPHDLSYPPSKDIF